MKNDVHLLKHIRTCADVTQQDVAFLLSINTSSLARYENEKRMPTPEILLSYHILFGIPINEILTPLYKTVASNIFKRSELLLAQQKEKQTPKSKQSIAHIQSVAKNLSYTETYDN